MSTARPILMSAPMVRALIEGTKTQTRRIVKPQPPAGYVRHCLYHAPVYGWTNVLDDFTDNWFKVRCPYGQPGDLLWVRERWTFVNVQRRGDQSELVVAYNADGADLPNRPAIFVHDPDSRWYDAALGWFDRRKRPSIHMPRWASRLTLRITDVRVEQLQDISDEDAKAEGVRRHDWQYENGEGPETYRDAYACLWDHINGEGSWDQNPWCWCIQFECIRKNVDEVLHASAAHPPLWMVNR